MQSVHFLKLLLFALILIIFRFIAKNNAKICEDRKVSMGKVEECFCPQKVQYITEAQR